MTPLQSEITALVARWRDDMENAPRDGVILLHRDGRVLAGKWYENNTTPGFYSNDIGDNDINPEKDRVATHWCPLPAPPGTSDDTATRIVEVVERAERDRDYAIRWANRSVDMLKDAFFPVADALRALEAYLRDTPHHNAIEAAAARKALATFDRTETPAYEREQTS